MRQKLAEVTGGRLRNRLERQRLGPVVPPVVDDAEHDEWLPIA